MRLGDQGYQIEAQICLAQLGRRDGDIISGLRVATGAARQIGSGPLEMLARCEITTTLEARGEHEAAIEAGREALGRAGQLGLGRYVTAPIAGNLAESLVSAGRWGEALEIIDDGLSRDLAPFERECMLTCRGQIAAARGDQETAARMVEELRSLPATDAETHRAFPLTRLDIEVRLAGGDLDGALAVARTVPGVRAESGPRSAAQPVHSSRRFRTRCSTASTSPPSHPMSWLARFTYVWCVY